MLVADWQNPLFPQDATDDGKVDVSDAVSIIRDLRRNNGSHAITTPFNDSDPNAIYLDADGNTRVEVADAINVIRWLRKFGGSALKPQVALQLQADTGVSPTDKITKDANVTGTITTQGGAGVGTAKVRVNRGPVQTISLSTGGFNLTPAQVGGIADGDIRVGIALTDTAGGQNLTQLRFTLDTVIPLLTPPHVLAADDTGIKSDDNITRLTQPRITFAAEAGAQLQVKVAGSTLFSGAAPANFTQATQTLSNGTHQVDVTLSDVAGNSAAGGFSLVVDTVAPPVPTLDLAPTSDTGTPGDQSTSANRVTLAGLTEANTFVTLASLNQTVRTSGDGTFRIPNVPLADGDNSFTFSVSDLAGNVTNALPKTIHHVTLAGTQDPVLRWDQAILNAIVLDATPPPVASRGMAMVSVAMLDAVNAIEGTPGFLVSLPAPAGISAEAAVSTAAFVVMNYLYPGQAAAIAAVQAAALADIPDSAAKTDAIAFGTLVGQAVVALRDHDGWNTFVDYVPETSPGDWQQTGPMYDPALLPQWGQLTPFAVSDVGALLPAPPPALTSQVYADSLNEIKDLGRATSISRTASQTQIARFWADGGGTYTPPGHWNAIAAQFAASDGLSLGENARLFAMLNTALGDAAIVAWDAKYTYDFWRPVTAIQNADEDGNDQTTADPNWSSLLITPPFPEYTSGHSTFSAAAAEVLTAYFGDNRGFTTSSLGLPGVNRTFTSFNQAAAEAGRSRVYGGIHYEFTNQAALASGQAIGEEVLQRFTFTDDTQAPRIAILSPASGLATSVNPQVQGWALDNLAGVASATVQVDSGAVLPLTLDSNGRFTFTPSLAVNGSADGLHVVHFRALDKAGLQSGNFDFTFTLDTAAPSVTITSPLANDVLNGAGELQGTVSGTGSNLVSLTYQLDAGTAMPLFFSGSGGSIEQALDLSRLAVGSHTLTMKARDAAGLETTSTVNFTLGQAAPLTIASHTPLAGASDVGTTFRPQVVFSRPINPSTLNATNFFATDSAGQPLAATIVPAQDGSFAWLFFANPLPGSSTISVHVDGETILAADGTKLDADGDGVAGGELVFRFTTVSLAVVPGTSLSGRVVDPGDDLKPMTFDDFRAGPDGIPFTADDVFRNPIVHAKVYILGLEDQFVYTDATGAFSFPVVPAGNIKLAIDGRTATNAPAGTFWPEMVMDLELEVGRANTVMGTMGTREEREAHLTRTEVYLPRLQSSILTTLSSTQPTVILADAVSTPNLTPEQRQYLKLEVQPNSAFDSNGQVIPNAQVGFSTVPPSLVRDMLPPGLMQLAGTLTVQAPGVAVFSPPIALTFPNIYGAVPGTQLPFYSFDHTTGRLIIEGTTTVSPDGKFAVTDPGSGISHPGWFGPTPPGTQVSGQLGTSDCLSQSSSNAVNTLAESVNAAASYASNIVSLATSAVGLLQTSSGKVAFLSGASLAADLVTGINQGFDAPTISKIAFDVLGFIPGPVGIAANLARGLWAYMDARYGDVEAIKSNLDVASQQADDCLGMHGGGEGEANTGISAAKAGVDHFVQVTTIQRPLFDSLGNVGNQLLQLLPSLINGSKNDAVIPLLQTFESDLRSLANQELLSDAARDMNSGVVEATSSLIASIFRPAPGVIVRAEAGNMSFHSVTGLDGHWSFVLPPNTTFTISAVDPRTAQYSRFGVTTGASGITMSIPPRPVSAPVETADTDGDGLADVIEATIGTSAILADTDHDGIPDLAEIQQGLDPLGGRPFATGIVASLPLQGEAKEVVIEGSTLRGEDQTAYVATGSYGLAVVNASGLQQSLLLGQLDLPGDNVDVSVDSLLGIAVVASSGGLHFVDVKNPTSPRLIRTINNNVTQVETYEGIAYAAVGAEIRSYDLLTGERLQIVAPGINNLTGLSREGDVLYAMDSGNVLRAIDVTAGIMTARGSLSMPAGGGKLFVASGVAYISGQAGGFATANVSNPASLSLLSGVDNAVLAGRAVVANGSGLGIAVGPSPFGNLLQVLNVADPTNTNAFLTQYPLPATPFSVALGAGIAFIAGGTAGLQVVNYRSFDNQGVAPTVTGAFPSGTDVNPGLPGVQVVEGSAIRVLTNISDDVQVRNVELLVNGQVMRNDVAFPFELNAFVPTIAQAGVTTIGVQVRATDTGGNVGLSPRINIELVPDTVAPTILTTNVPEGARRGSQFRTVTVRFSESLNPATITAAAFSLQGPSGTILPETIQFRLSNREVSLTFPLLALGNYQLVIDAPSVKDMAGNALGTASIVSNFTISSFSAVWLNSTGGSWNVASNWDSGVVPGAGDDVLIDVPGDVTVTFSSGTTDIRSLTCNEGFVLSGGSLRVAQTMQVNGTFTINGGSLIEATVFAGQGITIGSSTANKLIGVTTNSDLFLAGSASYVSIEGGTTFATAHLSGDNSNLGFAPGQTLNSTILFEGSGTGGRGVHMNGTSGAFTVGPSGVIRTTSGFGGSVDIGNTFWFFSRGTMTLVNQGLISSETSGKTVDIKAVSLSNQGVLQANNASTLKINNLTTQGTFQALNGSTLNVTTLVGNLNAVTLSGAATLAVGGTNYVVNQGLTLSSGQTAALNGTWTNAAGSTISATNATLNLGNPGNAWSNAGSLAFTNSTVNLGGSLTTAGLGSFTRSGGLLTLTGALNNTGATLALNAATGSLNLHAAQVTGGSITFADGQSISFSQGVVDVFAAGQNPTRLISVAVAGDLYLANQGASVTIEGGTTFQTAHLSGDSSALNFAPGQTLNSTILIEGTTNGNRGVHMNGSSGTLTIGPSGVIRTTSDFGGSVDIGSNFWFFPRGAMTLVNQGLISSETSGKTVDIKAVSLSNQGVLQANNASTLKVNNLTTQGTFQALNGSTLNVTTLVGNLNAVTLGGAATLAVGGTNYVVNQGLTLTSGQTATLNGTWTNAVGSTISVTNATLNLGNPGNAWSNAGSLAFTNSTVNLGGSLTTAGLGSFTRSGGLLTLTGALNNTGATLALNAATGSLNVHAAQISGGSITFADGQSLSFSQGQDVFAAGQNPTRLIGVAVGGDLYLANQGASVTIEGGTTFQTAHLSADATALNFAPGQTLNSTILIEGVANGKRGVHMNGSSGTLTIGPSGVIRTTSDFGGSVDIGSNFWFFPRGAMALINQGLISSETSGKTMLVRVDSGAFTNQGTVRTLNGATLELRNSQANQGTITAGAGSLLKNTGAFNQSSTGLINIELGGTSTNQFGQVQVSGAATLDGTLSVVTVNGFSPAIGNTFSVLSYSSISGSFAAFQENGLNYDLAYNPSDLTVTRVAPLRADGLLTDPLGDDLAFDMLMSFVTVGINSWISSGLTSSQAAALNATQFLIADLPNKQLLAVSRPGLVVIDINAAGRGWFIDSTPDDDSEFGAGGEAEGKIDLLTVVLHELGHVLGLEHAEEESDLMFDSLAPGQRKRISELDADALFAVWGS